MKRRLAALLATAALLTGCTAIMGEDVSWPRVQGTIIRKHWSNSLGVLVFEVQGKGGKRWTHPVDRPVYRAYDVGDRYDSSDTEPTS